MHPKSKTIFMSRPDSNHQKNPVATMKIKCLLFPDENARIFFNYLPGNISLFDRRLKDNRGDFTRRIYDNLSNTSVISVKININRENQLSLKGLFRRFEIRLPERNGGILSFSLSCESGKGMGSRETSIFHLKYFA